MEFVSSEADPPEAHDGESSDAVWEVTGIMAQDVLPDRPVARRRRSRLCALRAMDRLGLLDEENLIATLAGRPQLRRLLDEWGARCGMLRALGRIGELGAFEAALQWVLEDNPSTKEANTYIRGRRASARRPHSVSRMGRRLIKARTAPSIPHSRKAHGKAEIR